MARIRTFKAELFHDEKLIQCSVEARFLFLGLFPHCDDLGRLQYSFANLKGKVFPADDISATMVEAMVQELEDVGVIELYEYREYPSSRTQRWLRIPHFLRHQVINRPSHCTSPPSPTETDPEEFLCHCGRPECSEARQLAQLHQKNGRRRKRFQPEHSEDSVSNQGALSDSVSTRGTLSEDSVSTHAGREGNGREGSGTLHGESRKEYTQGPQRENTQTPDPQSQNDNAENRRAKSSALDELAGAILTRLHIPPNHIILNTLINSIEARARSRSCTIELSAASILARGAGVLSKAQPENWEDWLYDVRYDYVSEGDSKLSDRRVSARQVCGGKRCEDGWEIVRVGEKDVARRCPDCVKLWQE
jgi:hypothetical protein